MALYFKFSVFTQTWFQISIIPSSAKKMTFLGIDFFFHFIIGTLLNTKRRCDILKIEMNLFFHIKFTLISITREVS